MSTHCKCGMEHKGPETVNFIKDPLNRTKGYCKCCGRRVFISRYAKYIAAKNHLLMIG